MNILWLDLNSSYAHSSLALPALHAQLLHADHLHWQIVSATINENPGSIATQIYSKRPDVVLATCWLFNHEELMHVLCRVRALLPDTTIFLGGPEFLGHNEDFLRRNPFITCVLRGEGEQVFPQWLAVWNQPDQWHTLPGICYINADGQYIDGGIARILEFDQLVPPEASKFFNWNKPFVQLETTRGCFNTCAFCVSGGEKPVRNLDIDAIRHRIDLINAHGIKNIRVLDRTFNFNLRHALALLRLFREYPDIRFHLEVHPALLRDELKAELLTMPHGMLHVEAGIQSLHDDVLRVCRRVGKLSDALNGLRFLCRLDNMVTHADLIAGLPLYHLDQIFDDIRTLADIHTGEIQLESLKLLPGTEMRRRAQELGIRYATLPPYEVQMTNEITPDELQTARLLSRLLDFYYNTEAWQDITRLLILEHPDFLHLFLDHLIRLSVIDNPMSLERRGIILYQFCRTHYPQHLTAVSCAWIEAGMSLKKEPAEHVRTKHVTPPDHWTILQGKYHPNLRLCQLPTSTGTTYWYGFETEIQKPQPVFKAASDKEDEEV